MKELLAAVDCKPGKEFQALLDKVSQDSINQALVMKANNICTLLHNAAKKQDSKAFQSLIAKASTEAISQALVMRKTALHWAIEKQDNQAFQALIAKASIEAISQALVIEVNGNTPLHLAAHHQDSQAFQVLIAKASAEAISQALVMKYYFGTTSLHLTAEKQDSQAFQSLINKTSQDSINQALVIKDNNGDTPLHWAASRQDSQAFQSLVAKASQETIDQALVMKDKDGYTPLLLAASKQDSQAFQALIAKASQDAINRGIAIKDKDGDTPLHLAASRQDSQAFQGLVAKASQEMIDQALVMNDDDGKTPLHLAAHHQDSQAFQALIDRASKDSINQALVIKDNNGDTPLHWAASRQDSQAFQSLVAKTSQETIDQALVMKDKDGYTSLLLAAVKQDSQAFQALIAKASQDTINRGIVIKDKDGDTPLHLAARKQDSQAFQALIAKASSSALLQAIFPIGADADRLAARFAITIIKRLKTKDELASWVMLLLKIDNRIDLWPSDKPFSDIATFLEQSKYLQHPQVKKLADAVKNQLTLIASGEFNDTITLTIGGKTHIITPHSSRGELLAIIQHIKLHGLESWHNFYLLQDLKKTHPDGNVLNEVLMPVNAYNVLDASIFKLYKDTPQIRLIANHGHLAMKMFSGWQPQAWPEFLKQLQTPQKRAELRKPRVPAKETHKLDLLTGKIAAYSGRSGISKPHHTTHAKKQSATLISTERNTPLFQSHDSSKPLVGVALQVDANLQADYKNDLAKIRAMMLYDTGTYERQWIGNETAVNEYANKAKIYLTLEIFHAAISKETSKTNEILLEPSKGSLRAIVIGRDREEERKLALQYQQDVKDKIGIELPIILYEAEKQLLISLDKHDLIKKYLSLVEEKTGLLLQTSGERNSFFNSNVQYDGKIYCPKVVKRLLAIDTLLSHIEFSELCQKYPKLKEFNLNHPPKQLLREYANWKSFTWRHHKELVNKVLESLSDNASYAECLAALQDGLKNIKINQLGTLNALMQFYEAAAPDTELREISPQENTTYGSSI